MRQVSIPKIIAQTWKSSNLDDVPKHWKSSPASFKLFMSDWTYVLSGDKENREFVAEHFPEYLDCYDGFEHNIMRCDFWRYCWLFLKGGVYSDLDFEITQSLEELFYIDRDFYVCPSGTFSKYYTNAIMAAKPRCPVFLDCLKLAKEGAPWFAVGKHLHIMYTTGPMMFSEAVSLQEPSSYHILNSKLLTPCSVCDPKPCMKVGGYIKTLQGSSWCGADTKIYTAITCSWRSIVILITILLIIYLVILWLRAFRKPKGRQV